MIRSIPIGRPNIIKIHRENLFKIKQDINRININLAEIYKFYCSMYCTELLLKTIILNY